MSTAKSRSNRGANHHTHLCVANLASTSKNKCRCRTWLRHWRKISRSARVTCGVLGCVEHARVGAHVQMLDNRCTWHWWIAPLCYSHNHHRNYGPMWLDSRVALVSANSQVTGCYR